MALACLGDKVEVDAFGGILQPQRLWDSERQRLRDGEQIP